MNPPNLHDIETKLGLPASEILKLAEQDPLAFLGKTDIKDDASGILSGQDKFEPIEHGELLIREFVTRIREYVLLRAIVDDTENPSLIDLSDLAAQTRGQILKTLRSYGPNISHEARRQYDFTHTVTYAPERQINRLTFANFRHVSEEIKRLEKGKRGIKHFFDSMAPEAGAALPVTGSLYRRIANGQGAISTKLAKLEIDLKAMWRAKEVRMAYLRAKHMEYIQDIQRGRAVTEGPSTIRLLNEVHAALFGKSAFKVAGPALTGPPGWGKTSVFQDYFRSHGIEALSADVDPGQSAFTLMARPTIGTGIGSDIADKKKVLEAIDEMSSMGIKCMYADDIPFFRDVCGISKEQIDELDNEGDSVYLDDIKKAIKKVIMEDIGRVIAKSMRSSAKKGYEYCTILDGLQNDRPVILNEFVEMQEWSFLHGLLTAVPAADAEAAPKPSSRPRTGEVMESPKGWFWNTITSEWMRVPIHFRIVFTANIGAEFGNTGIPPALKSRIGTIVECGGLPADELAATVIWPHLSSAETGEFLLDDATAYRLHFVVTRILPKINEYSQTSGTFHSFAIRELISICKEMNPETNSKPCGLDEAIMRVLIRPTHAETNKGDLLRYIVALFIGTGYLKEYAEEIGGMSSDLKLDQLTQMLADVKKAEQAFSEETYSSDKEKFTGRCLVCGVKSCPCHGTEEKQYTEDSQNISHIIKLGLDRRLLDSIFEWQQKLAEQGQFGMLLESHFGKVKDIGALQLSPETRKKIGDYLAELVRETYESPEKAATHLPLIAGGIKNMFIAKKAVPADTKKKWLDYWKNQTRPFDANKLKVYTEFLKEYLEIDDKYIVPPEDIAMIRSGINEIDDMETLCLIYKLPIADKSLSESALKRAAELGGDLNRELKGLRVRIFQSSPNLARSAKPAGRKRGAIKIPDAVIQSSSSFDMKFGDIAEALNMVNAALELRVIGMHEVQDIIGYAERQLNAVYTEGKLPQAMIPYIRVIKLISQIKHVDLEGAIKYFLEDEDVPLPPRMNY